MQLSDPNDGDALVMREEISMSEYSLSVCQQSHKPYISQQSRCGEDDGTHRLSPSTPSESRVGLCIFGPCENHIGSLA